MTGRERTLEAKTARVVFLLVVLVPALTVSPAPTTAATSGTIVCSPTAVTVDGSSTCTVTAIGSNSTGSVAFYNENQSSTSVSFSPTRCSLVLVNSSASSCDTTVTCAAAPASVTLVADYAPYLVATTVLTCNVAVAPEFPQGILAVLLFSTLVAAALAGKATRRPLGCGRPDVVTAKAAYSLDEPLRL